MVPVFDRRKLRPLILALAIALCAFQLTTCTGMWLLDPLIVRATHVGLVLSMLFLWRSSNRALRKNPRPEPAWSFLFDILMIAMSAGAAAYIITNFSYIQDRMPHIDELTAWDLFWGAGLIIAILEATRRVAGLALVIVSGIALLYKGGDGGPLSFAGITLVMLSALAYAIYIVGVKVSALRELPGAVLTFYALLFGLSIYVVRLKFGLELQWIPSWTALANILMIAFLPTVISLVCTALAIRYIGATPTAILGALEPVTAVFFGVMVFGEQLTFRLATGIVMIIVSVSLIITGKAAAGRLNDAWFRLVKHYSRK